MLISRFVTLFLAPCGLLMSYSGLLPLSLTESIMGAGFGYLFLYIINTIFKRLRNVNGIGEGDFDLLLFIGSFTGIMGCWISVTIGSIIGSLYGLSLLFLSQRNKNDIQPLQNIMVPFGPFLALGALFFIFAHQKIIFHLSIH